MKKTILSLLIVLLVATFCYAQSARNPAYPTISGQTNVTNIGVTGHDVTGNPGFIMMRGAGPEAWDGVDATETSGFDRDGTSNYVLWVDETGVLCLASYATISTYSSFPTGNFNEVNMPMCTAVGGQS